MRSRHSNSHIMDLVFPLTLVFVFAVSGVITLILAANMYSTTTDRLLVNDEARTVLSYVAEKVRQSDAGGSMDIKDVDGIPCFSVSSQYNGVWYTTYIYEYDGMLKELFVRRDAEVFPEAGTDITDVRSFSAEEAAGGLYRFTAVDSRGKESSLLISERSAP